MNGLSQLLSLLILAAQPAAPIDAPQRDARHPDAAEVFHCGFEASADEDYDGWPDRWTRRRGPEYPGYLPVQISEDPSPEGNCCLRVGLNGGAVAVASPKIEIGSIFSYVLEGYIKTEGLINDQAYLSVALYDGAGKVTASYESERLRTAKWTKVRLGPFCASSDAVASVVIELHVDSPTVPDLRGTAWFDDVWLGRLPRISLSTNSACNVYSTDGPAPEITCQVSGILERDPIMTFELLDCSSQSVSRQEHRLQGEVVAQKSSKASALLGTTITRNVGFAGTAHWSPTIKAPGYYRARVTMSGQAGLILERETTLALLTPAAAPARGEFGWSLPTGDRPLSLNALGQLLPQVGINWVKLPVWSGGSSTERLDQLVAFSERLGRKGVQTVGMLDRAPPELQSQLGETPNLSAADILSSAADVWYPSLEPILTRLSLQVKWWQLGLDEDVSFSGDSDLPQRIAGIKKKLRRFGQKIFLGFGWRSNSETPDVDPAPWEFLSLTANPQLTEAEIETYLQGTAAKGVQRWLSLEPLSRSEYSLETRAADLVQRLVAARRFGADAIFVARPFDADCGLMHVDGTPGDLFLPWRTTATALAGAQHLGSLRLPGGSTNHVFARGNQVVVVLWNQTPTEEAIFLGADARQIDLWGRDQSPDKHARTAPFAVGPLPTFIVGASDAIVRWNLGFSFAQPRMPGLFGVANENEFVVKNYFPQGVGGEIRLLTPDTWKTFPRVTHFKLAAGEELRQPFSIVLPFDVSSGRHEVGIEVHVEGEHACDFTIHRELEVGLGDVEIEVASRLNAKGELEVEQKFTNHTTELVNFKCMLFAPERRRLVAQVIRLGQSTETKTYRFPNGAELVGKTLMLRCEEIGGQRILNQRFVAQE